jgi:hypothetical protein
MKERLIRSIAWILAELGGFENRSFRFLPGLVKKAWAGRRFGCLQPECFMSLC